MNRKIIRLLLIVFVIFGACKEAKNKDNANKEIGIINKQLLVGSWLDQSKSKLHFSLLQDGTARSDNMATLLYKKWKLDGTKLILTAKSIGNGNSFIGDEIYEIKTLTDEEMILQSGDYLLKFVKKE